MVLSQVEELQVSLAKGRWSQAWGLPLISVPSGASVRAWQSPMLTEQQQRQHFRDMVHGLAGLTGTALAAATEDDAVAWEPSKRVHPGERITLPNNSGAESDVLSAFLPWEAVCSENLQVLSNPCFRHLFFEQTSLFCPSILSLLGINSSCQPFLRLLPCRSQSLMGSITPQMFCGAHHSVVTISSAAHSETASKTSMFAVMKVMVVVNEKQAFHPHVSLSPCPVCARSVLFISSFDGSLPQDVKILAPDQYSEAASALSDTLGGFRESSGQGIDLRLICQGNSDCRVIFTVEWPANTLSKPSPFVSITQKLTYPTSSLTGNALVFHNPTSVVAELEVTRYISWFARPLSSSLSVSLNGSPVDAASVIKRQSKVSSRSPSRALEWRSLGLDSFNVSVPANSTLLLYAFIERSYVHWERHQPDAHRGLDLPPVFVWHNSTVIVVDSPIFLVSLPDFSMP
jgi:hypothetical protein